MTSQYINTQPSIPLNDRTEESSVSMAEDTHVDLGLGSYVGRVILALDLGEPGAADAVVYISTQNAVSGLGIPIVKDGNAGYDQKLDIYLDGTATIYGEWVLGTSGTSPTINVTKVKG